MTKKIKIPYFPVAFKFEAPILAGVVIYLGYNHHYVWAVLLMLLSIIILATAYVTEVDLKNKVYRDYLWFLGLSLNKDSETFTTLDRVIITKGNYAQTANTRIQSRTINWSDYTATLLHDHDGALALLTRNSKTELLQELKEFVSFLNVDVEDRTSIEPYWIDMTKV